VQTLSAAATQQAGVTLREWQAYAAAHAAAAKAAARVAPAAPQPPRQLKRLRKAGQDIGGDGGGGCTAPGGGAAVTASTNPDVADAATDGDAETAPASWPTNGQPETAADTPMPDAAPEGGPEAETAAVDQKPEPDAGAERQLPTQSEEQPPGLSSELPLQAIIMLPPQVRTAHPCCRLASAWCGRPDRHGQHVCQGTARLADMLALHKHVQHVVWMPVSSLSVPADNTIWPAAGWPLAAAGGAGRLCLPARGRRGAARKPAAERRRSAGLRGRRRQLSGRPVWRGHLVKPPSQEPPDLTIGSLPELARPRPPPLVKGMLPALPPGRHFCCPSSVLSLNQTSKSPPAAGGIRPAAAGCC